REKEIQLVQVGQIVGEESLLPEASDSTEEDEQCDEDIADRTTEVTGQFPLEDRPGQLPAHSAPSLSLSGDSAGCPAGRESVVEWALRESPRTNPSSTERSSSEGIEADRLPVKR